MPISDAEGRGWIHQKELPACHGETVIRMIEVVEQALLDSPEAVNADLRKVKVYLLEVREIWEKHFHVTCPA